MKGRNLVACAAALLVFSVFGASAATDITPDPNAQRLTYTTPHPYNMNYASLPAIAYDPGNEVYLAAWTWNQQGNANSELFGQLLDSGMQPLGSPFEISDMGNSGAYHFASHPQVVFDESRSRFLVVWWGAGDAAGVIYGDSEVFGRFVEAGGNMPDPQFQVSYMGPPASTAYIADYPRLAYDGDNDRYFVIWRGTDTDIMAPKRELYGRFLAGDGTLMEKLRISETGDPADTGRFVQEYDVTWKSGSKDFFAVWTSTGDGVDFVHPNMEAYGSEIRYESGPVVLGFNRYTYMTEPSGGATGGVNWLSVAWQPVKQQYLLAWSGTDGIASEGMYGRLLDSQLNAIGRHMFDISDGHTSLYRNRVLAVDTDFVVLWSGLGAGLFGWEYENWGRTVESSTALQGPMRRISYNGPDGDPSWNSSAVDAAYNYSTSELGIVWHADTPETGDDNFEIYKTTADVN